jgi:hypothetical protein
VKTLRTTLMVFFFVTAANALDTAPLRPSVNVEDNRRLELQSAYACGYITGVRDANHVTSFGGHSLSMCRQYEESR